jgi:hypothetical protein
VRQAPPVSLRCDGSRAWRAVQALLAATACASLVAWLALHAGAGASGALAAAALCAAIAGAAIWRRLRPQPVELQWDGQRWALDGAVGRVDVMMDLGPWLLLRFRAAAGRDRWLSVPRAGRARHGLRAALYSRAADPLAGARPAAPGRHDA